MSAPKLSEVNACEPPIRVVARAYQIVDARLDDGPAFQKMIHESSVFRRAVEEARELRAYAPGILRRYVTDAGRAALKEGGK